MTDVIAYIPRPAAVLRGARSVVLLAGTATKGMVGGSRGSKWLHCWVVAGIVSMVIS